MDRGWLVVLLLVVHLVLPGLAQPCVDARGEKFPDCLSCLVSRAPACGWCLDKEPGTGLARGCLPRTEDCEELWYNDDRPDPAPVKGSAEDSIKPREIKLKLRPNKEKKITFEAKKKDNPVDMYFLLDLTGSMTEIKKKLADITEGLMDVRILSNDKSPACLFFCSGAKGSNKRLQVWLWNFQRETDSPNERGDQGQLPPVLPTSAKPDKGAEISQEVHYYQHLSVISCNCNVL